MEYSEEKEIIDNLKEKLEKRCENLQVIFQEEKLRKKVFERFDRDNLFLAHDQIDALITKYSAEDIFELLKLAKKPVDLKEIKKNEYILKNAHVIGKDSERLSSAEVAYLTYFNIFKSFYVKSHKQLSYDILQEEYDTIVGLLSCIDDNGFNEEKVSNIEDFSKVGELFNNTYLTNLSDEDTIALYRNLIVKNLRHMITIDGVEYNRWLDEFSKISASLKDENWPELDNLIDDKEAVSEEEEIRELPNYYHIDTEISEKINQYKEFKKNNYKYVESFNSLNEDAMNVIKNFCNYFQSGIMNMDQVIMAFPNNFIDFLLYITDSYCQLIYGLNGYEYSSPEGKELVEEEIRSYDKSFSYFYNMLQDEIKKKSASLEVNTAEEEEEDYYKIVYLYEDGLEDSSIFENSCNKIDTSLDEEVISIIKKLKDGNFSSVQPIDSLGKPFVIKKSKNVYVVFKKMPNDHVLLVNAGLTKDLHTTNLENIVGKYRDRVSELDNIVSNNGTADYRKLVEIQKVIGKRVLDQLTKS